MPSKALPDGEFLLPIFPLPNLVFLPKTRLPLHIFEPRYRAMVGDALRGEERIGIVLLKPGYEADYYGAPPIHETGTAGTVEQAILLEDGRYNIILDGIGRFRILEEVSREPYRIARVVAVPEIAPDEASSGALRALLVTLAKQYLNHMASDQSVPELATADLESLTNALIMSLSLELDEKQRLLETSRLDERAQSIAETLTERLQMIALLAPFRQSGDPNWN